MNLLAVLILPLVTASYDSFEGEAPTFPPVSSLDSSSIYDQAPTFPPTYDDDVKSAETTGEYARAKRGAMQVNLGGAEMMSPDEWIKAGENAALPPSDRKKRAADSRDKRGDGVADGGGAKIVSIDDLMKEGKDSALPPITHFNEMKKRAVDKLADKDRSITMDGETERRRRKRSDSSNSTESTEDESASSSSEGDDDSVDPQFTPRELIDKSESVPTIEGSGVDAPEPLTETAKQWNFSRLVVEKEADNGEEASTASKSDSEDLDARAVEAEFEGSGNAPAPEYEPIREPKWNFGRHVVLVEGEENGDKPRAARWAIFNDFFSGSEATTESVIEATSESLIPASTESPVEGSGQVTEASIREVRDTESATVVLGEETPVVQAAVRPGRNGDDWDERRHSTGRPGRPDEDWEDRHRPTSTARPPTATCETVDCVRGTQCIMENGRPTCQPIVTNPQRTCRDVNCPRDSRCRMERDPRCRGRDCSEEPVCVRETSRPSCNAVQCPSGTRCSLIEEPGCRGFRCREVATCVNPCDAVRCSFGSQCRFDGRDAICVQISFDACMSARCPGGFECRTVQSQARCFPVNTPAPTLPPTTTPASVSCLGQNEEFAMCATFCEPTCVEKNPPCISACAAPRCQCANGFYRNNQGLCVFAEQCEFTPTCAPNEIFNQCSTACEPRCGQPVQIACPLICGPSKCQCQQGFFRHASGSCVQQNQCFIG